MALSQIQCLDDNHVNPRTHESKPEFLYCEDQRLALEALLRDGREAFFKYLEVRGLRGFLSDPELEALAAAVEPYDPGSELFPESAEEDEPPLSLHYWPELSDTTIPQMDLGWPDCEAYRGVTRTTMYSQPPLDGQAHIKEIIRKMIAQAQKVIAVVMDVFTDVDIFRDLLDAGFKRRISVYILLERATLPHFLSMCLRANMHAGHLKNLRVRCTQGVDFHTRTSTKVRGRMGHRFMFIDGDKAVSGSYSFTWMSSRLEKNLITVVTGQAVDAFDRLFRVLYLTSTSVDLRRVATEPEPEPEPLPQPAAVAPPSAALARKLYNPKYALALGNPSPSSSPSPTPTPSAGCNSPKQAQSQENSEVSDSKKRRRQRVIKEPVQEAPPLHPGLVDLEKACLMTYLPTWPEPDPPSDVIGFINIRDTSKPTPVHLQRSEMSGTSQAIRFSSPISVPKENLPEVATPRQATAKHEEMNKPQPAQGSSKAEEAAAGGAEPKPPAEIQNKAAAPQLNSPIKSDKDAAKPPTNQEAGPKAAPPLKADAPPQSGGGGVASAPNAQAVSANSPEPGPLAVSDAKKEKPGLNANTGAAGVHRTRTLEADGKQSSPPRAAADSGLHTQTQTAPTHTQAVHTQPQISSKMTPNAQTPVVNSHPPPSSTSAKSPQPVSPTSSGNNHISTTTSTTSAPLSSSCASSLPPFTSSSSSTTVNPPLLSSSTSPSLASSPPVPKPRTVQLVMENGVPGDQKLPGLDVVKWAETGAGPAMRVASGKEAASVPEPQNRSGSKTGAQKEAEKTGNIKEAAQQKQSETLRETKNEEAVVACDDRAATRSLAGADSDAKSEPLIRDAPKAEKTQGEIPKDVESKTLTSADGELNPRIGSVATAQAEKKAPERATASCEVAAGNGESVTQHKTNPASAADPRKATTGLAQQATGASETADPLKSLKLPAPVATAHTPKDGGEKTRTTAVQPSDPRSPPAQSPPAANPAKHNALGAAQNPKSEGDVLRSPTSEKDSQSHAAPAHAPTLDGLPPRTPTPDSRTHTPDSRSSDFRTPTPLSDGYASPRPDSGLSTTSDEYYECSSSPLHEPAPDRAAQRGRGTPEDHVSLTHANAANATAAAATAAAASSACKNSNAATLSATEASTFSGETQALPGPACISSPSSLLERKAETGEKEAAAAAAAKEENGGEAREKRGRTEGRSPGGTQRRGSEEAKRTADHLRQGKGPTETVESNKEAKPPKRQRVLNQSAAERLADGGVTPGKLTNEVAEPKRSSAGDLKVKKVSAEGGKPDKEKAAERAALGPSGAERRSRPQSTREAEGQKFSYSSVRSSGGKQHNSEASSPTRPSRPPRAVPSSALGPRPWGSRQLGQSEGKALHGSFQALDNARRPPSRPPPPALGSTAGRRQPEVSQSLQGLQGLQGLLSRQPQGGAGAAPSPGQLSYAKPQTSFLHSHHPLSHNRTASAQEAHTQEDGKLPFSLTFSRLYNLKGLKDKMSKLPAPSKRGSAGSPVHGHKSSS